MDEERVEYSYTGDVSSLKQATQAALSLLDQYQRKVDSLTNSDAFGKNVRAARSFQAALNSTTKEIEKIQKQLASVGDVKLGAGSAVSTEFSKNIQDLQSGLTKLSAAEQLTTAEVRTLTAGLRGVKQGFVDSGSGIDAAIQKEKQFQSTLSDVKARAENFRDTLESMRNRVSGVFDPLREKLNTLANPFSRIAAATQSFRDKAQEAFDRSSRLADACASAFRRVQQSEEDASGSADRTTQAHRGLVGVLDRLRSLFSSETEAVKDEEEELNKKNKTLNKSRDSHNGLRDALVKLGKAFKSEASTLSNFSKPLNVISTTSAAARRAIESLTGVKLGEWLAESIKQSISYVENLNLFTVAMGRSAALGLKFVATMSELYGMDPSNLYRYSGYFYQLTDAIGMTDKASTTLSLSLTKAANDIASLFNVDIETVVNNLASGMQGMSRAVRKYGMDIRATTLQETAYAYGLTEKVANMSEANRMALRYLTMLQQVKKATSQTVSTTEQASGVIGDFARNIETPANQLRIFKEQITQLGRAIGNFFVPALRVALPLLNGFIMALRTILQFLAAFMSIDLDFGGATSGFDREASAIEGVGAAASDAAKSMKKLIAPFDELNILSSNKDTGGGGGAGVGDTLDPALADAIAGMSLELDKIEMKANKVRDSILAFLGFNYEDVLNPDTGEFERKLVWLPEQFEQNLINKFPQWSNSITALFDNWSGIISGLGNIFSSVGGVLDTVKEKVIGLLGAFHLDDTTVATFITELPTKLTQISDWIDEHSEEIANFIILISTLALAFQGFQVINTVVGFFARLAAVVQPVVGVLQALGGALAGISATTWLVVAAVAAVIVILVHLWNTSETFRESVQEGVDTLIEVLKTFWETTLKPIIDNIWQSLQELWENAIKPVIEHVIKIVGDVIELIMALWNNVLGPIIRWLMRSFGPGVAEVFNAIWNTVSGVVEDILQVLDGLLIAFDGVIEFLVGVFSGDWERAWSGLVNILVGVGNTIISTFELVLNSIIGLVNSAIAAIWGGIRGLINSVLSSVEGLADLLGYNIDISLKGSAPQIERVSIPRIPMMARGGVVTSPTMALLGEGHYDEAVIPLGNSPQMSEFVDRIVDALGKDPNTSSSNTPVEVKVYLDSKEVTGAQTSTNKRLGKTVQKV